MDSDRLTYSVTYLVTDLVTYFVTYLVTDLVILTCNTRLTYLETYRVLSTLITYCCVLSVRESVQKCINQTRVKSAVRCVLKIINIVLFRLQPRYLLK